MIRLARWIRESNRQDLKVQKVLRHQYFVSRYPQMHYYILHISLGVTDQKYCTEYETPVLDEITDLSSAVSHDVKIVVKGKSLWIETPKGHRLKTRLVNDNKC